MKQIFNREVDCSNSENLSKFYANKLNKSEAIAKEISEATEKLTENQTESAQVDDEQDDCVVDIENFNTKQYLIYLFDTSKV